MHHFLMDLTDRRWAGGAADEDGAGEAPRRGGCFEAATLPGQPNRANTRLTCTACHVPCPLAVGMPRSLSAAAMPTSDVTPAACSSRMTHA